MIHLFALLGTFTVLLVLHKKVRQMSEEGQKLKEVRDRTAHPFLECRQALQAMGWDVEKAIRLLQSQHKPVGLMDG